MKKYSSIFLILIVVCIITMFSNCHKSNEVPACDCGVATDITITYDNYMGNSYEAYIAYDTSIHPNGWVISAAVLNMNSFFVWKICNPDSTTVKQIIDTIPKLNGIPVRGVQVNVAGKMMSGCPNDPPFLGYQGVFIPETYFGYITIDSLQKNK